MHIIDVINTVEKYDFVDPIVERLSVEAIAAVILIFEGDDINE